MIGILGSRYSRSFALQNSSLSKSWAVWTVVDVEGYMVMVVRKNVTDDNSHAQSQVERG